MPMFNWGLMLHVACYNKVCEIISKQFNIEIEEIRFDSRFVEDFGVDSLDLFKFKVTVEENFGTKIPDEDVSEVKTVDDVVNYLLDSGAANFSIIFDSAEKNSQKRKNSKKKKAKKTSGEQTHRKKLSKAKRKQKFLAEQNKNK